ncbi:MAG TPA: HlyD family efflux transporter periplasmic adaptor subunit [Chloroflexota bacterium]|nr:HlyD family efflux transporter periplasmic adaptor subunit [Chloroflexota bacterium]
MLGTVFLLAACGQGETAELGPTPTPLPTPIVPERPTYTVQRGAVVNSLEFTGRVSPVQEQALFFKSEGFVDQVFVQRGDQVEAGDILAQLEITGLQNQLAQAQVSLETAEIRLAQAEQARQDALAEAAINREKILLQLQQGQVNANSAAIIAAQIDLDNARQRLADAEYELQKSLDREWEPENLRRQYEQGVASAQDALRVAQARYNDALAGSGSSVANRQLLEQDLALADLRLEQLERGIDPLLALEVERVRLEVEKIETQIADAQLIAPFDGEVLSLNARAGSRAEAFQTAVILAQPQNLEITAELGSAQLNEMSVGQTAVIILRNRLDDPYNGVVRQLPYAFSGGTAGGGPQDNRARIQFDEPPANLTLGELATVIIVLEEKEDVLWLPPAAIRTFQGRSFVVIQEANGQRRADVRLGIQSADRVEVLEGVAVGEVVVGE